MKQQLSRFRCQGGLAELSQCLLKAHAFKVMVWTRTELDTFKWTFIYFSTSHGDWFHASLLITNKKLLSSSRPDPNFFWIPVFWLSVLPALDLVSASSARHMVLCTHFLKPFCYQTAEADVFARMRLAGLLTGAPHHSLHSLTCCFCFTRCTDNFPEIVAVDINLFNRISPFSQINVKVSDLLVTAIGVFWLKP